MKKEIQKNNNVFEFGQVMSMLEAMNDGIKMIAEVQSGHSEKFEQIDKRFDKLENKVDKLQDDMTQVKHDLKRKVDYEEFALLEKRLVKLEKLVLAK